MIMSQPTSKRLKGVCIGAGRAVARVGAVDRGAEEVVETEGVPIGPS